jgi:glycerol-3-phosphate acyltransferase PlsY
VIVIGYLLGSIPFGHYIIKNKNKTDVRNFGSGKTGATNVLRTAGKKWAALTAFLDISKGMLAVVLANLIMRLGERYVLVAGDLELRPENTAMGLAAIAAIAGHIWPIFLKFRGGRGVAVFFGTMISLNPVVALYGGAGLLLAAGITRYASLGSIIGSVIIYAVLSFLAITRGFPFELLIYGLIGTLLIIIMHRDNIERLVAGKERKLGDKADRREPRHSSW